MTRRRPEHRVLVVGLDCLEPSLVFDRWRDRLPTFSRLMDEGTWGPLRSVDPPITVPAWSCMFSGRDPGELGIYGFRNRRDWSYAPPSIATGSWVKVPRLWDLVGDAGGESVVVGVPGTWPVRPMRGRMVAGFLAPGLDRDAVWPPDEARRLGPDYLLDVPDFRGGDPARVLADVHRMTEARFALMERWMGEVDWDLAMMVEIGVDRLHHAFWHHMDPEHVLHPGAGSPFEHAIRDYYVRLDALLARLVAAAGPDTHVLVVSDHGAQRMDGGVRLNEWLVREGWLVLAEDPAPGTPLSRCRVDWSRTRAWGEGGYVGRIFLNVAGREPDGVITPDRLEIERAALARGLESIPGPDGAPLETTVHRPEDLYREVRGHPPDLLVYFDDLRRRALGTLGHGDGIHSRENDTGPDGANHAMDGVFILREAGQQGVGRTEPHQLLNVFPVVLGHLGLAVPGRTR